MRQSRLFTSFAVGIGSVVALAACGGGDGFTSSAIEQAIENETGEDVNFQFDNDGSFSFETDEGTINFDATGDGSGVVTFDTDEGTGQATVNEDGSTIVETDDGATSFFGSSVPDNWPGFLGVPATLNENQSIFTAITEGTYAVFGAELTHDAGEDFAGVVGERLLANGFTVQDSGTGLDGEQFTAYARGADEAVTVIVGGPGQTRISYTHN